MVEWLLGEKSGAKSNYTPKAMPAKIFTLDTNGVRAVPTTGFCLTAEW